MSTLSVTTIQGLASSPTPTTIEVASGHTLHAPGHIIQVVYNTPASGQTMTDVSSQSSITLNNSTTRGTATCSVTRKDANSFFIIQVGCTMARAATTGELRIGYRIGSGSDVVAYYQDGTDWVRGHGEFKDTTTGSVGDVLSFESVLTTTGAANSYIRHISMSVMEIAQ